MIQNLISMFRTVSVQFQNLWDFYSTFGGIQTTILIRKACCCFFLDRSEGIVSRVGTKQKQLLQPCLPDNNIILQIIIVTSSKTANFTKIPQNMPTFQSPLDKATRPKAKLYNVYMVAYGPNHLKFQYLCSRQAYIAYHRHQSTIYIGLHKSTYQVYISLYRSIQIHIDFLRFL